jgi:hypothetical protein
MLGYIYILQIETHVISSIVHIAHQYDDDSNPWPIEIEDHDGNLKSVVLEEGQVSHLYIYVYLYALTAM